jgi:hypothetical protein
MEDGWGGRKAMFNVQCSMFNVQCSMFNVQCSMRKCSLQDNFVKAKNLKVKRKICRSDFKTALKKQAG